MFLFKPINEIHETSSSLIQSWIPFLIVLALAIFWYGVKKL